MQEHTWVTGVFRMVCIPAALMFFLKAAETKPVINNNNKYFPSAKSGGGINYWRQ